MGVSTNIYIPKSEKGITITGLRNGIEKALVERFSGFYMNDIKTRNHNKPELSEIYDLFFDVTFSLNFEAYQFSDNKEHRRMMVTKDPKTNFIRLSIEAWGHNTDIARAMVDYFGGHADFNDCDGIYIDYCKTQPK